MLCDCSKTVCAVNNTDAQQEAECLRGLDVESLMSVFPWDSWLNEQFYYIPAPAETSSIIAVIDGNVNYCSLSVTAVLFSVLPLISCTLVLSPCRQSKNMKQKPASFW